MKKSLTVLFITCILFFNKSYSQTYTVPGAQVQPEWVFPVWFEDGIGNTDTAYLCYDPSADNFNGIGHDTIFGEEFFSADTNKFFISMSCICPPFDTISINTEVFSGLPSVTVQTWKARLPLKIKWDKSLFYDSTLLTIPIPNQLPNPLFEIKMWCGDFNPNYINCGVNYPIFWVPEDNIGCCPDPYSLGGIRTDSMVFWGDTVGPLSIMNTPLTLNFGIYQPWVYTEDLSLNPIQLFPNPTSTIITLSLPSNQNAILSIFNLLGEKVKEEKVSGKQATINVSSLPQGVYLVRTENRVVGRFVKE